MTQSAKNKKILESYGLKLGDKIQIGRNTNGGLLNGQTEESAWCDKFPPIVATVVGILDGQYPLTYIDSEEFKKLDGILGPHNSGEVDKSFKSKVDLKAHQRWGIIHKTNYKHVNTMSKIKEKYGVDIGDSIEVFIDRDCGVIETSSHDDEVQDVIKGTIVGEDKGKLVVFFEDKDLDDNDDPEWRWGCRSFKKRPSKAIAAGFDHIDHTKQNFAYISDKSAIAPPEFSKKKSKSKSELTVDAYGNKRYLNKKGQYHRTDGPASISVNGNREWFINGKKHREDGPAVETSDRQEWWIKGKYHREDGPAVTNKSGKYEEWYIKGKLHREDGPAIKDKDNCEEYWYINGKLHRENGPAVIDLDKKEWHLNGKRHRVDGPAIKYVTGEEYWFLNGKAHREDGPAVKEDGFKEWWINGKQYSETEFKKIREEKACQVDSSGNKRWYNKKNELHRTKLPAVEYLDGTKEWYKNGKLHRKNAPAIERSNGTKEWWLDNNRHREDGPAIEYNDGQKEWWNNNRLHREDGPAIESALGDQYWYVQGVQHREDGPAVELKNGRKEYWLNGVLHTEDQFNKYVDKKYSKPIIDSEGTKRWRNKTGNLHRSDGPAVEWTNGTKEWLFNGDYHRADGPAIEWSNGAKEWYVNGNRHREDGPAIECQNGESLYYIYGTLKTKEEFEEYIKAKTTMPELQFGLHVGDKIYVKRDSLGRLIDGDQTPDTTGKYPPVLATIVGCAGKIPTTCIEMDPALLGSTGGSYTGYKSYIHKHFVNKVDENKRFWNIFSENAIVKSTVFGVNAGDEVLIGKAANNTPIDNGKTIPSATIKGKVVGFLYNTDGSIKAPLVYIDRKLVDDYSGKYNQLHKRDILPQFLNDKNIDLDTGCFWYIYDEKAIQKLGKENTKMDSKTEKPAFFDMIKSNAHDAAYRVASVQMTKGVKAAILAMMEKNGHGDRLGALSDLLDSEMGAAIISAALGYSLTYMPKIGDDPRAQKLASEFRINGMATVGNVAMDMMLEHIVPVVVGAMANLPAEKVATQARIAESSSTEEEEQQEEKEGKRATA